ncbi:hypothetical protein ABBQ32_009804 [Trebouxia sp. C0010 RCD-2024]
MDRATPCCPTEFICPITQEVMSDPVLLSETGQTYERTAILDWFRRGHRTCPATNTSLASFQLAPNYVLKSLIQQQQPSTSYASQTTPQTGVQCMYPTLAQQQQAPAPNQLQNILQRLSSPSMQVPAYRSGSSYSLWQLQEMVKDPLTHPVVMQAHVVPTLVALLLDCNLPECQEHVAGILRRLAVRSASNSEAIHKAGATNALIQLLSLQNTDIRAAAAGCLCLLGWNSKSVKSEIIFSLWKAAKDQTGQISAIQSLLPLFASGTPAEQQAATSCLHMLSDSAPADVLATFELGDSRLAQSLCLALTTESQVTTYAATECLRNLVQLPANKVESMQQILNLVETGTQAGQLRAALLCWELCCLSSTTHNPHMTALISSQPRTLPAISAALKSADPEVVKAALGMLHLLALESKAQNTYRDPANVDLVRTQLLLYTPVLDAIRTILLSEDPSGQVVAAHAATNLAAFRSGVCPECDKSSPSYVQQPSRKRDFLKFGRLLDDSQPESPTRCRHTSRGLMAGNGIVGRLYTLLESSDPAVVSAVLTALYNISATENLADGVLQDKLLKLLSWNALPARSKDAARMLLQRLDVKENRDGLSFTFMSAFCLPPPRSPVYLEP